MCAVSQPGRVELALEAVGQRPDPRGDAVGKALAVQVAQERGSEHFEGALQLVEQRLPRPPGVERSVEQQEGLPASPAIPRVTHPVTDPIVAQLGSGFSDRGSDHKSAKSNSWR
jgi:hypothetical protein